MVNIRKDEDDRLVRGLSVFTTKPESAAHLRRIEEARKNFLENLQDGDSRKDALKGALLTAANGNEAKYEAAYAAAYGVSPIESETEEVQTTSDDSFKLRTINMATPDWRTIALAAIGAVVGFLLFILTWQPWVFDKFMSKELWLLGVIATLLYGILVVIAGVAAGLWIADTLDNQEDVVKHESLPNEETEPVRSDSSRKKLDVH